jgi:hypothetical protein
MLFVRLVLLKKNPLRGAKKMPVLFLEKEPKSSLFSLAGRHPQNSVLGVVQGLSLPTGQEVR